MDTRSTVTETTTTTGSSDQSMMMVIVVVIVVIVVGIAIFLIASNSAQTPTNTANNTTTPPATPPAVVNSKTFALTSQNGSGQDGTVTLLENGSTTAVTITLSNPNTVSEPAHIHLGSCPTPGAVKFPLTDVINGVSVTNINANFSDLAALGAIAVNVHKSAAESTVYVSCGDLAF